MAAIKIGIADLNATNSGGKLVTIGLGSCVAVALYDPITKIGGLAHIMLPNSCEVNNRSNPAKFADTAIPKLIELMEQLGSGKKRMIAKIAGGARMFSFTSEKVMNVGDKNVSSVKTVLKSMGIPLRSEDVGGRNGRSVELDSTTGKFQIRTLNQNIEI